MYSNSSPTAPSAGGGAPSGRVPPSVGASDPPHATRNRENTPHLRMAGRMPRPPVVAVRSERVGPSWNMTRRVGALASALAALVASPAEAQNDGAYGRFERDLMLSLGAGGGVSVAPDSDPEGVVVIDARMRWLDC